jgi:glycosyltransferase involved in cell wall biosynthesis
MKVSEQAPLTVVVLTYNEERNLAACLESVAGWASEIFVVDSGSDDRTVAIAEAYGAKVVGHSFESHAKQWRWALEKLPLSTEWILALDADQRVTAGLREDISQTVAAGWDEGSRVAGCFVKRKQIFRGRWIKHGGYYPKYLLKLFRRNRVWVDDRELVDHHFYVRGAVTKLQHDLVEENRNEADLSVWLAKHVRYASLQAEEEFRRAKVGRLGRGQMSFLGTPDARTLWLKGIWECLPLYLRPCLYFFYRYIVRLGFLDGSDGFVFHVLQGFWYRLLVDIKLDELRRARGMVNVIRDWP